MDEQEIEVMNALADRWACEHRVHGNDRDRIAFKAGFAAAVQWLAGSKGFKPEAED